MSIKNFILKYCYSFFLIFLFLVALRIFLLQFPLLKNLDLEIAILYSLIFSIISGFGGLFFLSKGERLSSILFLNFIFIVFLFIIFLLIELFFYKCPISEGVLFFPLFLITSSIFSLALSSIYFSAGKKKGFLLLSLSYIALILYSLIEYYFEPQLFLFNPLVIYYPGLVYNEVFEIERRILIYTAGLLVGSLTILMPKLLDDPESKLPNINQPFFYIFSILIFSLMFLFSDELGLSTSQKFLEHKFPLKIINHNYEILIQDKSISDIERKLIELKVQFHYQSLVKIFGYEVSGIQIFIFDSDKSKKEFLGDEVADFTKPWLKQIFVTKRSFDQTIKHELAHIFFGESSKNLFKVASRFNLGLIEGGAMAIEWDWLENTPDYYSAMIKRFSPELDLEKFFDNYTFATQKSSLSYLISGAFCKFLIEKYGLKKFLEFYREGDYSKVFSNDLKNDLNEFSSRLNSFHFTANDSLKFKVLFGGQTLFERKCPRSIGRMKLKAKKMLAEKSFKKAEEIFRDIYQKTSDQDAFMNLIRTKFYQKKFDEVIKESKSNEVINQFNGFSSVYLKIYYALSLARTGNQEKAKEIISQLKSLNISSSWNSYFNLILFLISEPELIDYLIEKNLNQMLSDLKKKFSEETSILVNDLENLNDQELDKVLQTYRYNPWILKDCFYRYIMLGNFTKANSIIEMINNEFPEINEAFQYQLDLMTFILEKLETNEESK